MNERVRGCGHVHGHVLVRACSLACLCVHVRVHMLLYRDVVQVGTYARIRAHVLIGTLVPDRMHSRVLA